MKKILAMGLVLLMTGMTLCGCGGGSGTEKENSNTGNSSSVSSGGVEVSKEDSVVKVIDLDLTDEEYAFGVDKDQDDLLQAANEFIKEIKQNGKFD